MTASTKAKTKPSSSLNAVPVFADSLAPDLENPSGEVPTGPVFDENADAASSETPASTVIPDPAPATAKRPVKLTGDALQEYAEAHRGQGLTAEELAIGAGYVVVGRDDGKITANPTAYSKALLVALGLAPAPVPPAARAPGGGRKLAYRVKSNADTGTMAVTGAYLRELGAPFGSVFTIIVDKEAGELVLQVEPSSEAPQAAGEGNEA
jgi:hypothetical protein